MNVAIEFRNLCDPDGIVSAGSSDHGIGRRACGQRRAALYWEATP